MEKRLGTRFPLVKEPPNLLQLRVSVSVRVRARARARARASARASVRIRVACKCRYGLLINSGHVTVNPFD